MVVPKVACIWIVCEKQSRLATLAYTCRSRSFDRTQTRHVCLLEMIVKYNISNYFVVMSILEYHCSICAWINQWFFPINQHFKTRRKLINIHNW
jgi:hypothetical protein